MAMSRRELLTMGTRGGVVVLASSVVWGRMVFARHQLASRLMDEAATPRSEFARSELDRLPALARQDIEDWFQTPCRNCAPFVDHICSESFAQKLSSLSSEQEREQEVRNAFVADVVQEHLILQKIEQIAEKIGGELDENWKGCCETVQNAWALELPKLSGPADQLDLLHAAVPHIRAQLSAAVSQAEAASQRPVLSTVAMDTIRLEVAVLMLAPKSPQVAIPLSVAVAIFGACKYLLGLISSRPANYRKAISGRLTQLATDIGRQIERETRQQISVLHQWQDKALEKVARDYANAQINLLS
ncbi:MAG: hypothetical protein H6822_09435 [Planctomycetaceae bacterium]|nr:hypothetical protein [Planctomycetales bacterium]MCB9922394.1 hypothetical protein [Planctomycetaceae bacterium]